MHTNFFSTGFQENLISDKNYIDRTNSYMHFYFLFGFGLILFTLAGIYAG